MGNTAHEGLKQHTEQDSTYWWSADGTARQKQTAQTVLRLRSKAESAWHAAWVVATNP